jgi:hypothetical protein
MPVLQWLPKRTPLMVKKLALALEPKEPPFPTIMPMLLIWLKPKGLRA